LSILLRKIIALFLKCEIGKKISSAMMLYGLWDTFLDKM